MKLIVGLGNPGTEYAHTRHNIGFGCLDELLATLTQQETFQQNKKLHGVLAKTEKAILLKPQTFMNLSGKAVAAAAAFYKISVENIWVIHDELDIEFGRIKIQKGGGSAGHNGIKSIIESVGSSEFIRWRIGVGKPIDSQIDMANFVLEQFHEDEKAQLEAIKKRVSSSIEFALSNDIVASMNKYN